MKKYIILLIVLCVFINVKAEKYSLYQLIPANTDATVETENFLYENFYYNDNALQAEKLQSNHVIFSMIKNLTKEERPITISIGVFDKDKKNIGIVNFCSTNEKYSLLDTTIKPDQEMNYAVGVLKKHMITGKSVADVKYIAILGDNIECKMAGTTEGAGKTVEEMEKTKDDVYVSPNTMIFVYIVAGVIGLGIVLFVVKMLLTGGKSREDMIRAQYGIRKNNDVSNININTNTNTNTPNDNSIPNNINNSINTNVQNTVPNNDVNSNQDVVDHNPANNNPNDNHGDDLFNMYK